MRRYAVVGTVLVASTVLAAMGLAQSGAIRSPGGRRETTSLADRLTALRESLVSGSPLSIDASPTTPTEQGGRERSILRSSDGDGQWSHSPQGSTAGNDQTQDRPGRPRLLSQLDPFNLLSGGSEPEEVPARTAAPAGRSPMPMQESASLRRNPPPQRSNRSAVAPIAQQTTAAPYAARRSPLVRQAEEAFPSRPSTNQAPSGVALGPAASESVSLPNLGRPSPVGRSTPGVIVRDVDPPKDTRPPLTPAERPLEAANAAPQAAVAANDAADRDSTDDANVADPARPEAARATTKDNFTMSSTTDASMDDDAASRPAQMENQPGEATTQSQSYRSAFQNAEQGGSRYSAQPVPAADTAPAADGASSFRGPPMSGDEVLSSDEAPAVAWDVSGPRQIIIGRQAVFEIRLRNDGDDAAQRLIARVEVPANAEIVSAETSVGVGQRIQDGASAAVIEWRIDQLPATRDAVLKLTLVPRTSETMNLEVSVRTEPRAAVARVDVLEPKLRLALEGPSDVLFGEQRTYRLTVSNPGTGPAENVVVQYTPPGQGDRPAERHEVGLLGAGEAKTIDLDITPELAGDLVMQAVAGADGDLRDNAEHRVLVRKPELVVDARGPQTTYAGTVATYYFHVQNTGDAIASDVVLNTNLPLGSEFIRGVDDRNAEPVVVNDVVTWNVGALAPGEELYMELKCVVNSAGDNSLKIAAASDQDDLSKTMNITTHVVALADLKLEVSDPQGPVAVGKEAVYEVRVRNRGSNSAEQINVAALFSEGIDPVGVEGGQHSIENGRVAFRTIESLPAGREIIFKIRAIAQDEGTHVFRAEVLCRELETKLAAEETTRFYLDETMAQRGDGIRAAMNAEQFESR